MCVYHSFRYHKLVHMIFNPSFFSPHVSEGNFGRENWEDAIKNHRHIIYQSKDDKSCNLECLANGFGYKKIYFYRTERMILQSKCIKLSVWQYLLRGYSLIAHQLRIETSSVIINFAADVRFKIQDKLPRWRCFSGGFRHKISPLSSKLMFSESDTRYKCKTSLWLY